MAHEFIAQKGEPRRPDPVQGAKLALGVPPLRGEAREPVPLGGIEGARQVA
jgi:hypothetical protein